MLGCFALVSCDGDPYQGFGCVAPESHPAVAYARTLSPKQLETVYFEVQNLSIRYDPDNYETQTFKTEIPESLLFLDAEFIRVYRSRGPNIILANCFDERIELTLSPSDHSPSDHSLATITLHWAEPTNENPYSTGSQILWQRNK